MKLKTKLPFILGFACIFVLACQTHRTVHIYMIGVSTMANKHLESNPERGWGQLFQQYFTVKE